MHRTLILAGLVALCGCQALAPGATRSRSAPASGDALARLAALLPGDYDNHEQVAHGSGAAAATRVQHDLRVVEHAGSRVGWLWRLQATGKSASTSVWLMRAQLAEKTGRISVVPFRPLDPAATDAVFADPAKPFRFEPAQWAELSACAQEGAWDAGAFHAAANVDACSALLPGLGETAALLPLRFRLDGEMLRVATFSDSAHGADALEQARRVRWFDGWAAINGGGPQAKAGNQDWHFNRSLRLSSEGGRVALKWRDGSPSGYTLELERTTYAERKLAVLQLNVIEDARGEVTTYAWSDPKADAIGLNLGWLQAGFTRAEANAPKP